MPPTTATARTGAITADGAPELGTAQREALEALRASPAVKSAQLLSVTLVTDSVHAVISVTELGSRPYRALLAPSGRVHRL